MDEVKFTEPHGVKASVSPVLTTEYDGWYMP
jgi:hypothetical protein